MSQLDDFTHGCGGECRKPVPGKDYVPLHLKHCDTPTIPGQSFVTRPEYPDEPKDSCRSKSRPLTYLASPKSRPLTYLASPYSHPHELTRRARFGLSAHAAAWLVRVKGWNVFSPIVHSHPLAEQGGLQGDWGFWENFDREYLACSERLVVLELDGWRQSTGVQAEIKIARDLGIPVEYIRPCNMNAGEYQLSPVPMLTMDEAIKANPSEPIFPNETRDQRIKRMVDEQKCEEILAIVNERRNCAGPTSKADTANPKDIIGATKVSLSKVPAVAIAHEAHAMMDGARKYSSYNWRAKAVQASIYVDAALRHIHDWNEGEEDAPDSKAHHLGHARACLGILLDCQENGTLIDDRPVTDKSRGVMTRVLTRLAEKVKQMPPLK